jgi:hypothetical protein
MSKSGLVVTVGHFALVPHVTFLRVMAPELTNISEKPIMTKKVFILLYSVLLCRVSTSWGLLLKEHKIV